MKKMAPFLLCAAFVLFPGCVYIPTPVDDKPFAAEDIAKIIVPGKTTRAEVLQTLGTPAYRYLDDRLIAYYDAQLKGIAISFAFGPIMKSFLLVVEFDDRGTVIAADRISGDPERRSFVGNLILGHGKDEKSCTANGFCLANEPGSILSSAILFAPQALDAEAKRFAAPVSACDVYVAIPRIPWATTPGAVWLPQAFVLDDRAFVMLYDSEGLFYRIRTEPGPHILRQFIGRNRELHQQQNFLTFSCEGGDTRFVEVVPPTRSPEFRPTTLRILDETDGRLSVRAKRWVIPPMPLDMRSVPGAA